MLTNATYQKKFYYLLAAIVLFSIVSYKIAIKKTIMLRSEFKKNQKEIASSENISIKIKELKDKLSSYNYSVEESFSKQPVQVFILDYVVEYCKNHNIVISEYPKTHSFKSEDYTVETNRLLLRGDFNKMLILVYNIEQKYRVGKVSSIKFFRKVNNKTKTNELYSDIYIQTIKRNE